MTIFGAVLTFEAYLYLALGFVALGIELWALIDCVRRPAASFEATLKRTKGFWMAVTGGAAIVGVFSALYSPGFDLFKLVAVVAAGVYLADVKPAVSEIRGRGNQGPYGPW